MIAIEISQAPLSLNLEKCVGKFSLHKLCSQVRGCLPSLTGEEGEWVERQMELVEQALAIREDGDGG